MEWKLKQHVLLYCSIIVVSDLMTVRIPCCFRKRRRVPYDPLINGSTAIDLISVAGSFGDIRFFGFSNLFHKKK